MKSDPNPSPDKLVSAITLKLPDWLLERQLEAAEQTYDNDAQKMTLAVGLARENVERQAGGPFGAAIFSADGRLISVGVNLVLAGGSSIWHAEMVAITAAQYVVKEHRLGAKAGDGYTLATSCEPCAMCLGAIGWSGVRKVIAGARDSDVRAIGFDEGHKPVDWVKSLEDRGISVATDVQRDKALAVLKRYQSSHGEVY
jgi:tRNA(Arg) A34 adenosine deaminase TadA